MNNANHSRHDHRCEALLPPDAGRIKDGGGRTRSNPCGILFVSFGGFSATTLGNLGRFKRRAIDFVPGRDVESPMGF
jgi:hypothetical protein